MKAAPESIALLQGVQEQDLYEALLQQLQKDLNRANVALQVPDDIAPEALCTLLREQLYLLLLERFDDYLNLMYAVDVPEKELAAITPTDAVEVAGASVYLLLKREWQKLAWRNRS